MIKINFLCFLFFHFFHVAARKFKMTSVAEFDFFALAVL